MSLFRFDPPQDIDDLAATLRRTDLGGPLRGLELPKTKLLSDQVANLTPQVIDQRIQDLAQPAARLTKLVLTPEQRQQYGRIAAAPQSELLTAWANASVRAAAKKLPVPGLPAADQLTAQRDTHQAYGYIARTAAMGVTKLLDLRLVLGGLMWFLVQHVTRRVVAQIEDPKTPVDKSRQLKESFAPLLLHKDQILRAADDQRAQHQQDQDRLDAQLKQAQRTTLVTDVMYAIRMGYPVDPQQLLQAAQIYQEQQAQQQAAPAPAAAPATAGRRPIVR